MASSEAQHDSDDGMDELMDKFKTHYKNAFSKDNWEEEFDRIPMFMKKAPKEIDPLQYPELACLQAIVHDEDRPPEVEQAASLKDEGNAFFKEKNYKKAILSYTAGLKKKCGDQELDTVLLTNRAAAHFHLGNMRSALNDAGAAKKIKPDHLKALIRATERDARKAKIKDKKLHAEKEDLLAAIKARGIKLLHSVKPRRSGSDSEDEDEGSPAAMSQLNLDCLSSQEATGAQVFLDEQRSLHWPVLFLYPEHQQTDFISAFSEKNCFIDHLAVMFGEELPPWDVDRKYHSKDLQLYFEDEEKETLYQVNPETSLLKVLQHKRCFVKSGSPSFIVLVRSSSFWKQFLTGKKIRGL
ncbi:tetratricopeptide repeat protein 4 [Lycodopsis pacificus]